MIFIVVIAIVTRLFVIQYFFFKIILTLERLTFYLISKSYRFLKCNFIWHLILDLMKILLLILLNIFHTFIWFHYLNIWRYWIRDFWRIVRLFLYTAKLSVRYHALIFLFYNFVFFFWYIYNFFNIFAIQTLLHFISFLKIKIFWWHIGESWLSCTNRFIWCVSSLKSALKNSYLIYLIFI